MLDHLLWGVPNLEDGIQDLAQRSGVTAAIGGRHPGIGTHNALLDLGSTRYLEIIAADPTQDRFTDFGLLLRELAEPGLLTWAARTDNITSLAKQVRDAGLEPGEIVTISRRRPDGELFQGRLLQIAGHHWGPLMPFFIQIDEGSHPSRDAPAGCNLASFALEHPDDSNLHTILVNLGLEIDVRQADHSTLRAEIDTPNGRVRLSGAPSVTPEKKRA